MSKIEIHRSHSLGADEARERVKKIEPSLKEKYGVRLEWSGKHAAIKGFGVSGDAEVDDSHLVLTLKLGLLVRPFKRKIQEAIERSIDRELNA